MSISLHTTGAVVVLAAVAATPALAGAPLTTQDARSEVRATARMSVRAGDASGFEIRRCSRVSPRRVDCVVRFSDVRREGRTCTVKFSTTLRDGNYATRPSLPACRS